MPFKEIEKKNSLGLLDFLTQTPDVSRLVLGAQLQN